MCGWMPAVVRRPWRRTNSSPDRVGRQVPGRDEQALDAGLVGGLEHRRRGPGRRRRPGGGRGNRRAAARRGSAQAGMASQMPISLPSLSSMAAYQPMPGTSVFSTDDAAAEPHDLGQGRHRWSPRSRRCAALAGAVSPRRPMPPPISPGPELEHLVVGELGRGLRSASRTAPSRTRGATRGRRWEVSTWVISPCAMQASSFSPVCLVHFESREQGLCSADATARGKPHPRPPAP